MPQLPKTFLQLICFALSICVSLGNYRTFQTYLNMTFTGTQSTMRQKLDHFTPLDKRTFSQRYWVADEFYTPNISPIFLYICPEATCSGFPTGFPYQVAQKAQALMLALEHRYYGLSQPFGGDSMKVQNLVYLTVEQALEDVASFIQWFKTGSGYQVSNSQPWITIGGSYAGALSSWFRYKYPHLTQGAWSASGVVNSILDFYQFDYQIYLSTLKSGLACPQTIQNLTQYFEYQLYNTTPDVQQQFKAQFGQNALKLSNDELLWYIADSFVLRVQYGNREDLCTFLSNNTDFDQFVNNTIQYLLSYNDVRAYGSYFVSNDTFDPTMEDVIARQWNYQVCSQLGWFQTPSNNSLRSARINLAFYQQFCQNAYGIPTLPDTVAFDLEFGGVNLQATNLVMTNGCEDPWQWATKNTTTGSMTAVYIGCDDCGHCVDFKPDNSSIPPALQQAHATIEELILSYVGEAYFKNIFGINI